MALQPAHCLIAPFEHGVQGFKPGGQLQVGRQGSQVIELLLDPLARFDGLAISPVAQGGIQAGLGGRSVVGIGQIG